MPSGVVTADIVRLRVDAARVRPRWVSLSINEAAVVKQVEQITAGVTRPKVTLRDVRNLCIRVPKVDEQDYILARKASLDRRIEIEAATLGKLGLQKSGLMDDLLTGRVRVTPLLEATPA
jgi:type I restriction enzyme S subunit